MFNVHIEMPSGQSSRGYDRHSEESAKEAEAQILHQLQTWSNFTADIVITQDGKEISRTKVSNA